MIKEFRHLQDAKNYISICGGVLACKSALPINYNLYMELKNRGEITDSQEIVIWNPSKKLEGNYIKTVEVEQNDIMTYNLYALDNYGIVRYKVNDLDLTDLTEWIYLVNNDMIH